MAVTTISRFTSAIRTYIANKFQQGYHNEFPFQWDATKHSNLPHEGEYSIFPNLIQNGPVTVATAEGSNVAEEYYKTSGVKVKRLKFGSATKVSIEAKGVTISPLVRGIIDAQILQSKQSLEVIIAKILGYSCPCIRADGDSDRQAYVSSSADGDTSGIVYTTDLATPSDSWLGGRLAVYNGSGMGQGRYIQDDTLAAGVIEFESAVGAVGIAATDPGYLYVADLPYITTTGAPKSYAHVSTPKALSSAHIINSEVIGWGQHAHKKKFKTPRVQGGGADWNLYLDADGFQDFIEHDSLFREAVNNYKGDLLLNPSRIKSIFWNTSIKEGDYIFQCSNAGLEASGVYDASGAVHFYPLCGDDAFAITDIKLWGGNKTGGLNFFQVLDRDHTNYDLAYITLGWVMYVAAVAQFCTRNVNLMCGTSQST